MKLRLMFNSFKMSIIKLGIQNVYTYRVYIYTSISFHFNVAQHNVYNNRKVGELMTKLLNLSVFNGVPNSSTMSDGNIAHQNK